MGISIELKLLDAVEETDGERTDLLEVDMVRSSCERKMYIDGYDLEDWSLESGV